MNIFKQSEIDKAAEKFDKSVLLCNLTTDYIFKAGVKYAESKIEEILKEYSLFLGIETDGSLINDFLKERNND